MTTLPTCPREDCTASARHYHLVRTGGAMPCPDCPRHCEQEHTAAADDENPCYAPRTPQPKPAAVVLPTVEEVVDIIKAGGFYSDTAQAVLDLIAARLPAWQPVETQPIDPADVRVGDRVRVEWKPEEATVTDVVDGDIGLLTDDGGILWASLTGDRHDRADLYLLHRPEPKDPGVAVVEEFGARWGVLTAATADARDLLARIDAARSDHA